MSSESEIQECKRIFLEKMTYRGSPKLPTELAAYLLLKSQKAIDEFFERKKNEELAKFEKQLELAKFEKQLERDT